MCLVLLSESGSGSGARWQCLFRMGGRGDSENWNGMMDELRVRTVARAQSQIQQNMFSYLTGDESGLYILNVYSEVIDGLLLLRPLLGVTFL